MSDLKYICDHKRHMICGPYSIENLHRMAEELGVKQCWFHKNHYDMPKTRIKELTEKCKVVPTTTIVEIIRNPEYAEIYLDDSPIPVGNSVPNNQVLPEYEVMKFNGFTK